MVKVKNIFIVEDDPISALLIKKALDMAVEFGKHQHFLNGKSAVEGLREFLNLTGELPDLVLLDLNMPVMNGWQFLDAIKQDPGFSSIEVIILTSSIDPADIQKSKTYSNVTGFLSKPLQLEELKRLIGV